MEILDVTVQVPRERVPEFYEWFGRWLGGRSTIASADGAATRELGQWSSADSEAAASVWKRLSDPARAVFSVLIDNPEVRYVADDLAAAAGIPHGRYGVAGTLAWPGRHARAVNREWPWSWEELDGGTEYWLTDDVASLFRSARDANT